ncbi:hypothetical protein BH09SUM1_BH09SUM1_16470 [soil metagenome]
MSKRKKAVIRILVVVPALIVGAVALWAYAALRSTGFDAAVAEVEERAKESGLEGKLVGRRDAAPVASLAVPAPVTAPKDFAEVVRELDAILTRAEASIVSIVWIRRSERPMISVLPMESATAAQGTRLTAAEEARIVNELKLEICRNQSPGAVVSNAPPTAEQRARIDAFNKCLDEAEALLLDPGFKALSFWDLPDRLPVYEGTTLPRWCLFRAVVRGDEDKAGKLVDCWMQFHLYNLLRTFSNRTDYGTEDSEAWQLLTDLAEIKDVPRSVFVRLASGFEQIDFSAEEVSLLRQQRALSIRRYIIERVQNDENREQNTFSFFMDGRAQAAAKTLFEPVFFNQLDEFVIAWNTRDVSGADAAWTSLRRTQKLLNLKGDVIGSEFFTTSFRDFYYKPPVGWEAIKAELGTDNSAILGGGTEMALLLTACALHRSETGRWPETIAALTKEESDLVKLDRLSSRFYIATIPAFHGPALGGGFKGGADPGWSLYGFLNRANRVPQNTEEVADKMREPRLNEERYKSLFMDYADRPLFLSLQPLPEKDPRGHKVQEKPGVIVTAAFPDTVAPTNLLEWMFREQPERDNQ